VQRQLKTSGRLPFSRPTSCHRDVDPKSRQNTREYGGGEDALLDALHLQRRCP
jgi:hypothetical protein